MLTGATSGIGAETAVRMAGMADTLIVLGLESEPECRAVLRRIRRGGPANVHYISVDFTHLAEVVNAARAIMTLSSVIDLLINDAALPGAPKRILTVDGFERTLQVNAFAPALLTGLVAPVISTGARVVNVTSSAHRLERFDFSDIDFERQYTPVAAYARAKLAMTTWSSSLAEERATEAIEVVALCPGLNDTPLSAAMTGGIGGPPTEGAARVLFAATADVPSGSYLEHDRVTPPSAEVRDTANRGRLAQLYRDRLSPFISSVARS
ncbi:SDR family NAD(P)-dependent oxidoreductase [Clavibacter sp. Sh2141]|uniref:SDR family NAD(P)-dependent oxidoreductase n=1 Tax=Clavibacter sp. Sh2141 TaxID=3395374 RepID=UPI0039BD82F1